MMRTVCFLFFGLLSAFAFATKNPYPVNLACGLVLYDSPGGKPIVTKYKQVTLPAFDPNPSGKLFIIGTRNGKTHLFYARAERADGSAYLTLKVGTFVGDDEVDLAEASTSKNHSIEPYDSLNSVYNILEANKRIGYFACGMYVQPGE